VLHDLAECVLALGFAGRVRRGLDAGDLGGDAARSGEQEMAGAAGRVDDLEAEQSALLVVGMVGGSLANDRLECGLMSSCTRLDGV
jgi:hypothetical protein